MREWQSLGGRVKSQARQQAPTKIPNLKQKFCSSVFISVAGLRLLLYSSPDLHNFFNCDHIQHPLILLDATKICYQTVAMRFLSHSFNRLGFFIFLVHWNILTVGITDPGRTEHVAIKIREIDKMRARHPKILSHREIRTIKTRLSLIEREVSVLMLIGRSKNSNCRLDPTTCIARTIANITATDYAFLDASDSTLNSNRIEQVLQNSLDRIGNRYVVMIDNIEKLPGSQVMNLFQFIDKDESERRRGLLMFVMYAESDPKKDDPQLKDAELVNRVLSRKWSSNVPMDMLKSVISRMVGSVVKLY